MVILDTEKSCPDVYADEWIVADLTNYEECLTKIKAYIDTPGNHLDGTLTFWEEAILLTAKITDTFDWTGNPFESVAKIKNKFTFREVCSEHGLPSPRHHTLKIERISSMFHKSYSSPSSLSLCTVHVVRLLSV